LWTEQVTDKPAALKLVLKVGAPYTPTDVATADSQPETVDNDSDDKSKSMKRKHQSERVEHPEKKVVVTCFMLVIVQKQML